MSSAIGLPPGALGIRWIRFVSSALHLSLFSGHLWSKIHISGITSNKFQFDKLFTGEDDLTNWGVKFEVGNCKSQCKQTL